MTLASLAQSGHNVAVVIPQSARDQQVLTSQYHVQPFLSSAPGAATSGSTTLEHSDPKVAPTKAQEFPTANDELATIPLASDPKLGSLQGKGLYVSKLAYELRGASPASQNTITSSFVGLVASVGPYPAWTSGLWTGAYGQILTRWGGATNIVLANGVDLGGFLPQVIERNGR
jgi:hypothetical protein